MKVVLTSESIKDAVNEMKLKPCQYYSGKKLENGVFTQKTHQTSFVHTTIDVDVFEKLHFQNVFLPTVNRKTNV